ncbi:MAG: transporter substrate-binding domain-containing protein [Proteobacteria bacterium]|nr:transporter substrate-binding domain-containing protein [Pseudomonadota bacterium]
MVKWALVALSYLLIAALPAHSQTVPQETPDAALARLLDDARSVLKTECTEPGTGRLARVLCTGRIRIGVRDYYPLFGELEDGVRFGYEPDIGLALAERLGVEVEFVRVNAASRIPLLASDRIDLVIATMGHNTQRDGQVRFIRPHYYQSETIVVGPRDMKIGGWQDMAGRTVCGTVGNGSNAEIVSHDTRLMLFDEAGILPDRLRDETCFLAAQDDSFFDFYFIDETFAQRFERKFGFAQVPWGMAVALEGRGQLAVALDLLSQIFHRDGVFLEIARKHRIGTTFLEKQRDLWSSPRCNIATGGADPDCVLPALDNVMAPTSFSDAVNRIEGWFDDSLGLEISLPMFKTESAWSLLKSGVFYTVVLVVGALAATLAFALLLGAAMGSRLLPLRWAAHGAIISLQCSPVVLTLVIAATVAHAFFPFSAMVAVGAAIVALGLMNGANAGQAIGEAMSSLREEQREEGATLFLHAVGRSASQLVAFLVNAAKGTPIASFIGAPELLSALTDITSFSSGRGTTYFLLLVFYTLVVMVVVWLGARFRRYLERHRATA